MLSLTLGLQLLEHEKGNLVVDQINHEVHGDVLAVLIFIDQPPHFAKLKNVCMVKLHQMLRNDGDFGRYHVENVSLFVGVRVLKLIFIDIVDDGLRVVAGDGSEFAGAFLFPFLKNGGKLVAT
jgi:hypothetical protein